MEITMTLRQARKIMVAGRPLLPGPRLNAQERRARRIVVQHWAHYSYPGGTFSEVAENRPDKRALNSQRDRLDAARAAKVA